MKMVFSRNVMYRILLLVLFFAFSMGSINAQKKRSGRSFKQAREYYDLADSLYKVDERKCSLRHMLYKIFSIS